METLRTEIGRLFFKMTVFKMPLSWRPSKRPVLRLLSFTAESEREKRDWMEALQEAIAETLSDYEVAEKIWSNRSNRTCADCKALNPDWASINLCVVICKNCAGTGHGPDTCTSCGRD